MFCLNVKSVVDVRKGKAGAERESKAFLFTVEAEEGGPLPRDTSLTHVTLNGEPANPMSHDHKGLPSHTCHSQ